ncbi:PTS fructose transporter subunit IIA [Candidatus Desulfarcum epimagneticum]|uniref:PTS fructose transporter subunit IIA n=1 Tax=uncultured Desulfobacteraceae bacterium TaxID=218296 RepID=A0A484HL12_9BACT|nr:PTS fructose transporter subunit IIA [uncultured Desulfobacteraceae bacterium]
MIGIVIVTHRRLGEALIDAAEFIAGAKQEAIESVSINLIEDADALRKKIADSIGNVASPKGVLVLTDMFGGTPSNLSYSLLEEGRVEVVSGVNLPMVIKALRARSEMEIKDLALALEEYGRRSINIASGILKGNKRA